MIMGFVVCPSLPVLRRVYKFRRFLAYCSLSTSATPSLIIVIKIHTHTHQEKPEIASYTHKPLANMCNSCDNKSASTPSSPSTDYSQFKQKLQEQLVDMCTSRGAETTDSTPSPPSIDYAMLSKFPRTVQVPVLEKQSATDKRPDCCFEGFAVNRARYFLRGVLEGRNEHQRPGHKERLQAHFADDAGPVHAQDMVANPLGWWLSKGILQGMIDKEALILPGENEKLEALFQVDSELLVLWLEKHMSLKKQHRDEPAGDSKLSEDAIRSESSEDDGPSDDKDLSINELYQYGQTRLLVDHLNCYHPDMSKTAFNIATAEARVRGEFKRMKTALEYLTKQHNQSEKIKSFSKHTMKFAEVACKFLKDVVAMYTDDAEASEQIYTAFFTEFATLYPNPKEFKGLDALEIEFQEQFVVAVAKALGSVMSEQDNE